MVARTFVLAALTPLALAACIHHGQPAGALDVTQRAAVDTVTLEVENHNWSDIKIYMLRGTRKVRLGSVTAASTATLLIPARLLGTVGTFRLIVNRLGGTDEYRSDALEARMASLIVLTVESDIAHSSVGIW